MERVEITRNMIGLAFMQVCAVDDATDEEILAVCNEQNPSGTMAGWCEVARDDYEEKEARPTKCGDNPDRKHFIIVC